MNEKIKDISFMKLEINIFLILLFLQDFALIRTNEFGIAALTVYLIFISIKYKFFMKINKKFLTFIIIFYLTIILSSIFNKFYDLLQICRITMIIFIIFSTYKYVSVIIKNEKKEYFCKCLYKYIIIFGIYGIYQLVASSKGLPIFMNIFCNNPSYSIRGIHETYSGWNKGVRIYSTFYEPSAYAIFLTNAYFFIINDKQIKMKNKIFISILVIFNIYYTYARSGWITFIYFICIILLFKILKKEGFIKKIGKIVIISLSLISVLLMNTIGLKNFNDLSSKGRTYSSLFYLKGSTEDLKSILVGHGIGSIANIADGTKYENYEIEKFAHNGYIDITYQLGWIFLIYLIIIIINYIKKNKIQNEWIVYASIFTLCCFGTMYYVESIISLVVLIVGFVKKDKI